MATSIRSGQLYFDPRTLSYEDQQLYHQRSMQAALQNQYGRGLLGAGGGGSGIGENLAQAAPKQEEPNKVLLLLPPVA